MKPFDAKIFYMIMIAFRKKGYQIDRATHIGDNVFEASVSTIQQGCLEGDGFTGKVKMEDGNLITFDITSEWMS